MREVQDLDRTALGIGSSAGGPELLGYPRGKTGIWLDEHPWMRGLGGSTLRGGQSVFHGLRMWGQLLLAAGRGASAA